MIQQIKDRIYNDKLQVIKVDTKGKILESENTIFNIKQGANINTLHPFFESVSPLLETISEKLEMACVNLKIDNKEAIVDINFIPKNENIYIAFFDFTEHYKYAHPLVQEKNEASIEKHRVAFERDLLFEKEKFKNSFLANINHEIRNPLNNLLGFMDILAEDPKLSYNQKETLNIMQKTGAHIKLLMDDMLDISKIEKGQIEVKNVAFNLRPLLKNLQLHFQSKFKSKPTDFTLQVADEVPTRFIGDPTRLNQILFNLVNNAFQHTEKGTIDITINCKDQKIVNDKKYIHFQISDTGVGIEEANLSTIFDSYYQLELNKIKPIGQGIGLRIVKELITLLNGNISVESELNKGTTFNFTIPLEVAKKTRKKKSIPKGSGILISKRILVVEDQEIEQMLYMKYFLNNDKAYYMEIARSPEQAIQLIANKKYDLVISKMLYTESTFNGLSFVEKINQHNKESEIKIPLLMVSGDAVLSEQEKIISAGAKDFLAKPFSKKELLQKVSSILE